MGIPAFVAAQNEWSLLSRDVEREVVPAAARFGLGIMPYFPLAMGFLSGKYKRGENPPDSTRLAGGEDRHGALLSDANFDRLERLDAYASDHAKSLLELAIGWLASHEVVTTVICGATREDQVRANAAAVTSWRLTAEEIGEVSAIVGM